jgi:ABC-2 type transport system ATP-binding protein
MIQFDNVTKTYPGGATAVDGLDLRVEDGELFVFLGPNGAGKTTSIKLCATLLQPTSGRVLVDGLDVTVDSLEARTRIGYLPENPFLYEGLSARQMLSFVGEVRSLEGGASAATDA